MLPKSATVASAGNEHLPFGEMLSLIPHRGNKEIELPNELKRAYKPYILDNGDTSKQLLARSRYLLFKNRDKWTPSQCHRAEILFKRQNWSRRIIYQENSL